VSSGETVAARPDWQARPCVIVASGPSLTEHDVAHVRIARMLDLCRVIVVNDNWHRVRQADVLYGADHRWWERYHDIARVRIGGERWTQSCRAGIEFGLRYILTINQPGLSRDPARLHAGANSGYQAINLAYHFGARRILLLGYDLQRTRGKAHWFGDHPTTGPNPLPQPDNWHKIAPKFDALAADLESEGVEVRNCSPHTALRCFPRSSICEALPC